MSKFKITGPSGISQGIFSGATEAKALLKLHRSVGYGPETVWLNEEGGLSFVDERARGVCGDLEDWFIEPAIEVAVWNENTTLAGRVCRACPPEGDTTTYTDSWSGLVDFFRDQAQAASPPRASTSFSLKVAKNVLDYLDDSWMTEEDIRQALLDDMDEHHPEDIEGGVYLSTTANGKYYGLLTDRMTLDEVVATIEKEALNRLEERGPWESL